jgi:hypothetical protein
MVWDPGIIISFSLVQFVVPMGMMALLEDKQSLGREDFNSQFSQSEIPRINLEQLDFI